jgi:hypothetical protein
LAVLGSELRALLYHVPHDPRPLTARSKSHLPTPSRWQLDFSRSAGDITMCVYTTFSLLSVSGWTRGCFFLLVTVNNVVMNTGLHILLQDPALHHMYIHTRVWDCWVIWKFYFLFHNGYANLHSHKGSCNSISSVTLDSFCSFDRGHHSECEGISYCDFHGHFSCHYWYVAFFDILLGLLCIFFGELSIQVPYPFLISIFFVIGT